jgi:hypothetical protein
MAAAARSIVEGLRVADAMSPEDAARAAMYAGGPSYEELVQKIRARRGLTEEIPA